MDRRAVTLQGWGDGVSGSEGPADPGTDSRAVKGAATFMRPERTAGLRTRWDKCGTKYQPVRTTGDNLALSWGDWSVSCHVTHHEAAVFGVRGQRHAQPHLVFPLRHVVQGKFPWQETDRSAGVLTAPSVA